MEHKRGLLLLELIIIIAFFSVLAIFLSSRNLTGYSVYNEQPNAANGEDTYIYTNNNDSHSADQTILIGNASTLGNPEYRGLLKFNVSSSELSGNTLTSAIIQLYVESITTNLTVKLFRVTSDWNESSAGWQNSTLTGFWTASGGNYSEEITSAYINESSKWYNLSILTLARGWVNGSYPNQGFILIPYQSIGGQLIEITSSDSATPANRPKLTIEYEANARPSILNFSTDTSFKNIGEQINFTINWTDYEIDAAQMFVCNSSNISTPYGCGDKLYCNTLLSLSNPISCNYTAQTTDNGTTPYFVSACDQYNCSTANSSNFYVNHPSTVLVTKPNGGEIVNQSLGNYSITFNVSDPDSHLLKANIYYGTAQNSTTYLIISSLNLTKYCTDSDSNTKTINNCSYSWNSTGVYGTYFLTTIVNDSFLTSNDSSNAAFDVRSISDNLAPNLTAQWLSTNYIYSGKIINFYANVTEPNIQRVWVSINTTPQTNLTMSNISLETFNASWRAVQAGNYKFKTYAQDVIGNLNDSTDWTEFSITKPNVSSQNQRIPSTALPYSAIRVSAELNATDAPYETYAFLNIPDGFTFLQNYPQNAYLGNFTENQIKNATWFLSTPFTEATYTLNVTYSDNYSNSWNSSNFQTTVTSSVGGGYTLDIAGYPEVQASNPYYAEASLKLGSSYITPDTILITIKDAARNTQVGASMVLKQTGVYNYSYTLGSSPMSGQWETIINATKSGTSYFANHFWNVVGALFDVRDINILNNKKSALNISVVAENVGNNPTDLKLTWNLTREDTGQSLASDYETFAVGATPVTKYYHPVVDYLGQVRITFIGEYLTKEKAGASKVFSIVSDTETPPVSSSGGGGGGAAPATPSAPANITPGVDFKINADKIIYVTKNMEKVVELEVLNTGEKTLSDVSLSLENLDTSYFTISPLLISSIKPGEKAKFQIKFLVKDFTGEKEFSYSIKSKELSKSESGKLIVLEIKAYFQREFDELNNRIKELKNKITPSLEDELKKCEDLLNKLKYDMDKETFINAKDSLYDAEKCINKIENKIKEVKTQMNISWIWIAILSLMLILIIAIVFLFYKLYKKIAVISFFKEEKTSAPKETPSSSRDIDERLKKIEEKLKD